MSWPPDGVIPADWSFYGTPSVTTADAVEGGASLRVDSVAGPYGHDVEIVIPLTPIAEGRVVTFWFKLVGNLISASVSILDYGIEASPSWIKVEKALDSSYEEVSISARFDGAGYILLDAVELDGSLVGNTETLGPWTTQDWPPGGVVPDGWSSNGTISIANPDNTHVERYAYAGFTALRVESMAKVVSVDIPISAGVTNFSLNFRAFGPTSKVTLYANGVEVFSTPGRKETYKYQPFAAGIPPGTTVARFEVEFESPGYSDEWGTYPNEMLIDNFGGVELLPISLRLVVSGLELGQEGGPSEWDYNWWGDIFFAQVATENQGSPATGRLLPIDPEYDDSVLLRGEFYRHPEAGNFLKSSPCEVVIPFRADMLRFNWLCAHAEFYVGGGGPLLPHPLTLTLYADTPLGTVELASGTVTNDSYGTKVAGPIDWSKLNFELPEFWTMFSRSYETP